MSNSKKEIKKYQKILNKVNELRDWAKGLNDEDFKRET